MSELLGIDIEWDGTTQSIYLSTDSTPFEHRYTKATDNTCAKH